MDAVTPPTLAPDPRAASPLSLTWQAPRGLLSLSLVNLLLRVLTLGVYGFWAKTEVRKRLWAGIRLDGEPLSYTGTGKELMLGFLVIFAIVVFPSFFFLLGAFILFGQHTTGATVAQFLLYLAFFGLWGLAVYRAQRYRLSRTVWRGIRGAMAGTGRHYAATFFLTGLLVPLTLGWILPWRQTRLQGLLVNDMRFGTEPFRFSASSRPLYRRFAFVWLVMATYAGLALLGLERVVTFVRLPEAELPVDDQIATIQMTGLALLALGYLVYLIAGAWYRAHQTNHFAAHTHLGGATFRASLTPAGLMGVSVTSFLITLFTFGILAPIAQARVWRYMIDHMAIDGAVDLTAIAQNADSGPVRGEGLAQAFDFDAV